MDLSPSKQSTAKRLSLLYLVFLAGVAFLSVDIWSRQLASSVQVPVLRLQQRKCDTGDSAAEQNGSVMLYVVTPTYTRYTAPAGHTDLLLTLHLWRLEQEAELTRLAQTLMLVPRLTWIVVEDSKLVTARLKRILERFNTLNIVLTAGEGYHSHKDTLYLSQIT